MHTVSIFAAILAGSLHIVSGQSIDPNSVPAGTKQQWCNSQLASCPLLCLQTTPTASTQANGCDTSTLTYSCICEDGTQPNVSEYSQTLPYFLCTEQNNNCVKNCGGNAACQSSCRENNPCGAQNPTRVNTTSSAAATATKTGGSAASSDAEGTAVYTGFGGSASTGSADSGSSDSSSSSGSSDSNAAATLLNFGQVYGLAVVASGLFAGFAIFL